MNKQAIKLALDRGICMIVVSVVGSVLLNVWGIQENIYHYAWGCAVGAGYGWMLSHDLDELKKEKK